MFLRFAVKQIDEDSRRPQGVFTAAYDLLDSLRLDPEESKQLRDLLTWFEDNLPSPPEEYYAGRAIFWFKAGSHESIDRIWELVQVLRLHDYHVEVHKCRRLANVSYEDDHQVAAFPSERDARTSIQ
jgi:hypothetical protein